MSFPVPTLESITFTSPDPGPSLLVFGAIHGNEVCGPLAIRPLIQQFQNAELTLLCGRVTFVPVANPVAYTAGTRYVTANLNRIFKPHLVPAHAEEALANQLCQLVDTCDYLLDLHSFHTPGVPFVFRDYADPATTAFAASLGVPHIFTGWPELYGTATGQQLNQGDTVEYAVRQGKTAVLVECGMHTDAAAITLATTCILNALRHLAMLPATPHTTPITEVRFTEIHTMPAGGGTLAQAWQNLDAAPAGTIIATPTGGTPITIGYNGFVIMPLATAQPGDEWFYLGQAT